MESLNISLELQGKAEENFMYVTGLLGVFSDLCCAEAGFASETVVRSHYLALITEAERKLMELENLCRYGTLTVPDITLKGVIENH